MTSSANAVPMASAIVVAAGRSERMGGIDKLFAEVAGHPLLYYTLAAFEACKAVNHVMLVLSRDAAEPALRLLKEARFKKVDGTCLGGARRQDSVRAGLNALRVCEWVTVHDAARPLVTPRLIEDVILAARTTGAATVGLPITDTVKEVGSDGTVLWTVDRERLWAVQTPQAFRFELLARAHEREDLEGSDDAALVEQIGGRVRICRGTATNLKVTFHDDLAVAAGLLVRHRSGASAR
jgi:2-C-methyl-D-erythritol 4-phosphate cytidylyltransferase